MNTDAPLTLPPLDDDRALSLERSVFARISADRRRDRTRRTRWWAAGGAAAAVVILSVAVAPWVGSLVSPTAVSFSGGYVALDQGVALAPESMSGGAASSESSAADAVAGGAREIVSSGSAAVVVDDVAAAAAAIGRSAEERGGYVESVSIGSTGMSIMTTDPMIAPYPGAGDGWISVRVPTDQLTAAIAELSSVGEVTSSSVNRQDVTDQAVDLRARISAAETSVARLTELIAQAQSTADLIAAESALQGRQAALDADRQQLASLDGQIELASLNVQLSPRHVPVAADPAGFGDGVAAGWNGLIATLNGIVIAFGFLLPWIGVAAAIALVVWGIVALVRRARRRPAPPAE